MLHCLLRRFMRRVLCVWSLSPVDLAMNLTGVKSPKINPGSYTHPLEKGPNFTSTTIAANASKRNLLS